MPIRTPAASRATTWRIPRRSGRILSLARILERAEPAPRVPRGNLPPGVEVSTLVQQLAQFGFGKQVKDGGGLTALVLAAREDCLECAQVILGAGAGVNQITNYGWTALL